MIETDSAQGAREIGTAIGRHEETGSRSALLLAADRSGYIIGVRGVNLYRVHAIADAAATVPCFTAVGAFPEPRATTYINGILVCRVHSNAEHGATEVMLWSTWLPTLSMVGCLEHDTRLRSAIERCTVTECNGNAEDTHLRILAFEFAVLVGICAVGAYVAPNQISIFSPCCSSLAVH